MSRIKPSGYPTLIPRRYGRTLDLVEAMIAEFRLTSLVLAEDLERLAKQAESYGGLPGSLQSSVFIVGKQLDAVKIKSERLVRLLGETSSVREAGL